MAEKPNDTDKLVASEKNGKVETAAPRQPKLDTEQARFFEFAKDHLAILATVSSIPLVSYVIGVIPAPPGENKTMNLTVLSSFICLCVFAGSFLLRGSLGDWARSQGFRRVFPFLFTGFLLVVAIGLTAWYLNLRKPEMKLEEYALLGVPIWGLTLLYLSIYPVFVLSLAVVLVTSFTQQRGRDIQSIVDTKLNAESNRIYGIVTDYAAFLDLAKGDRTRCQVNAGFGVGEETMSRAEAEFRAKVLTSPLGRVGLAVIDPIASQLASLSKGELEVGKSQLPRMQALLSVCFTDSFQAVSARDLDFWVNRENDSIAKEYFELNYQSIVKHKTNVARILILSRDDFKSHLKDITLVLKRHDEAGLGWAVAIYEELDPELKTDTTDLDFALFDKKKAVSFFRGYREASRRFTVKFNVGQNTDKIDVQVKLFHDLLPHCWAANERFLSVCKENINNVRPSIDAANELLRKRLPAGMLTKKDGQIFATEEPDLEKATKLLNEVQQKSRDWHEPGQETA
jgi:hypothetical protein